MLDSDLIHLWNEVPYFLSISLTDESTSSTEVGFFSVKLCWVSKGCCLYGIVMALRVFLKGDLQKKLWMNILRNDAVEVQENEW
jgi:hypothetical protein